jgi:hypothetical protein
MMSRTITDIDADGLDAMFAELIATYAGAETDPSTAIMCPQLNPSPHPSRSDFARHLDVGHRLLTLHDVGRLINVQLVVDGTIRACWGPRDPAAMNAAQLAPDGFAAFYEAEGGAWVLDTGVAGWVAREYFESYAAGGPFDINATDHPGLAGQPLTAYDTNKWSLTITRPTVADPWEWTYRVQP